jgi:ABC-type oligopeptide transport system substrate-binding subunit
MNESKKITALTPIDGEFSELDPSELNSVSKYFVLDNIGAKLLHINERNDYELMLAEEVKLSEDKLTLTIRLRSSKFSDGTPIQALDVARSINRLIVRGCAHIPFKDFIRSEDVSNSVDVVSNALKVIDNKTLTLQLAKPTRELMYYFTLADSVILHSSQILDRKLMVSDWKILSGAFFPEKGSYLKKNSRFGFFADGSPDEIELIKMPLSGNFEDLRKADVGYSIFVKKSLNSNESLPEGYRYSSDGFSTIVYLALNSRDARYSKLENRQWLHCQIRKKFLKDMVVNPYFKKADQFFLEGSVAFQRSIELDKLLPCNSEIPKDLKSGISILTAEKAQRFLMSDFAENLQRALGIPVDFKPIDSPEKYRERQQTKEFEIYLVPTSASYNVASESLNLLYKSPKRMADNPNGKVLKAMDRYQRYEGSDQENLREIIEQMTLESEIIPLFYQSSPKFYNSKTVDISKINPNESMTFWRMRVL